VRIADRGLLLRFERIVGEYRLADIGLNPSPQHSNVSGECRLDTDLDIDLDLGGTRHESNGRVRVATR
jgi:hypothetical protein